jgi:hypothetical protein
MTPFETTTLAFGLVSVGFVVHAIGMYNMVRNLNDRLTKSENNVNNLDGIVFKILDERM